MTAAGVAFDFAKLPSGWRPNPERLQSSLTDSELSTEQTVRKMCELIREGAAHPLIQSIARTLGRWGDGSPVKVAWDAFWFCKHRIRFALDEHAVLALFGEQDQVDFLISPPVLLSMRRPAGDCDDFTMLCCALLECRGVQWEIVTVACDRSDPGRWSHVYCRAILPDGRRLALDPTNGGYPGWEVPAHDVYRKQYWNREGNPVGGPESIRDTRMHAYVARRGIGDFIDEAGQTIDIGSGGSGPIAGDIQEGGSYVPPPGLPSTRVGGFDWSTILPSIIKLGGQLGTIAVTPKGGYVTTDAKGNLIVSNTGLPVATAGAGNLIFYLGIGLLGLLAFKAMSR